MRYLKQEAIINKPIREVFDFFGNAENLKLLTPPQIPFGIHTPLPIIMHKGTLIDYTIKISGIAMNWRTEIIKWEPPYCFIDKQIKGPYHTWIHEHTFEQLEVDKTRMTDTLQFQSPGWIFEPLVHHLFVNKKVQELFRFRGDVLPEIFGK